MGFSKNDFEKVDLWIKKITEQIEIDSEVPLTIEQLLYCWDSEEVISTV